MPKFQKKPVQVRAITFEALVAWGLKYVEAYPSKSNAVNGVPWSFMYESQPITHESDDCYLIPTLEGTMKFQRGDMLITGIKGEIYPCKREIFDATYLRIPCEHYQGDCGGTCEACK